MSKVHIRVQTIEDKIQNYVESHGVEIYVDYRDQLSEEQVNMLLEGNKNDVIMDIEESFMNNSGYDGEFDYYWEDCRDATGASQDDIDDWLSSDGYYPSYYLDDHGFKQLLSNTRVNITGIVWDAEYNFNNWAYGEPIEYSDVKETLKILGINPLAFKEMGIEKNVGSLTSGAGGFKGYFPNMPNRVPKVEMSELWDNMCVLYNGVMVFCLGDLENISEVLSVDNKYVTFKKGTNVVFYEYSGGAGITEVQLTDDVTLKRKQVDFRNDSDNTYGVQECYGFTNNYWAEGAISNVKA